MSGLNGAAGEEDYEYKAANGNNYASNYLSAISLGYPAVWTITVQK